MYKGDTAVAGERKSVDLRIEAVAGPRILTTSEIHFNCGPEEIINLIVGGEAEPRNFSEIELMVREAQPVVGDVAPRNWQDVDLEFLQGELEIDIARLRIWRTSDANAVQIKIPMEAFYGFYRHGLPTEILALAARNREELRIALQSAITANIIPASIEGQIDTILDQLQPTRLQGLLAKGANGQATPGDLIRLTTLPATAHEAFLKRYVEHQGTLPEFWAGVAKDGALKDHVDSLRFTFQAGELALNHLPLAARLQEELKAGRVRSLRDLAKLNETQWQNILGRGNSEALVPPDIPGETPQQRRSNFIAGLVSSLAAAFPTTALASRVTNDKDGIPGQPDLAKFFADNPDFDIRTTHVETFLHKKTVGKRISADAKAEGAAAAAAPVEQQLKALQRVNKLAPEYSHTKVLLKDGLNSASAIMQVGEANFVAKYSTAMGGVAQAKTVYNKAAQSAVAAAHTFMNLSLAFNSVGLNVLPAGPVTGTDFPDLENLFGSLDFCACDQCRSVHSAAAYFADILRFLKQRMLADGKDAKTKLFTYEKDANTSFDRRSDLGEILLSCENTNTPLPYIDLVNEILEEAVSPGGSITPKMRQTTAKAEDLAIQPQWVKAEAYSVLRQQYYPLTLPFDLPVEETRAFLGAVDVERWELMRAFQRIAPKVPDDTAIASEHLGFLAADQVFLTSPISSADVPNFYGFGQGEAQWIERVRSLPELLRRTGLALGELRQILTATFVKQGETLLIESIDADDLLTCDLNKLAVPKLTEVHLTRLYRFVRLWRKLGWSVADTDRVLRALGASDLTEAALVRLSQVKQICVRLNLQPSAVAGFFAKLDTTAYSKEDGSTDLSYCELVLADPVFRLNGTEFAQTQALTVPAVQAALRNVLRLDEKSLERLAISADKVVTGGVLNLENASRLYRAATLARAMGLVSSDFLHLQWATLINPFQSPDATLQFLDAASLLAANGLSPAEFDYLFWHRFDEGSPFEIPNETNTPLLLGLRNSLMRVQQDPGPADLPSFKGPLEEDHADARVSLRDELLRQIAPDKADDAAADVAAEAVISVLEGKKTVPQGKSILASHLGLVLNVVKVSPNLTGPLKGADATAQAADKRARFELVYGRLKQYGAKRDVVFRGIAAALPLTESIAKKLLQRYVNKSEVLGPFLEQSFSDSTESEFTDSKFEDAHKALRRVQKASRIIATHGANLEELVWLFETRSNGRRVNLNNLLVAPFANEGNPPPDLFAAWARTAKLFALRDGFAKMDQSLAAVLQDAETATPETVLLDRLSNATDWPVTMVQDLIAMLAFDSVSGALEDELLFARMAECFKFQNRLKATFQQCVEWSKPVLSKADADSATSAARTAVGPSRWASVAKPIRDRLRRAQRDALVDYLIAHPNGRPWTDVNGLFGYFLVDVEMSSCQLTSRLKCGIGSVQTFVERCRMGLEHGIQVDESVDPAWHQWSRWMKNYRIWEANCKIFLYPENWILPELRDDKTPFFKDLENELLQGEVTAETAENAITTYVEKLDVVAKLDMCGYYDEAPESGIGGGKLHFVAKTYGQPATYYYRTATYEIAWTDNGRRTTITGWSPWDLVEVDIEGSHILPIERNGRIFIFWLMLKEKNGATVGSPSTGEIQLAWTEFKNRKWSAKKVSKSVMAGPSPLPLMYFAKCFQQDEAMAIRVHYSYPGQEQHGTVVGEFVISGCHDEPATAFPSYAAPVGIVAYEGYRHLANELGAALGPGEGRDNTPIPPRAFLVTEAADELDDFATSALLFKFTRRVWPALRTAPYTLTLLPQHQDRQYASQRPFVYEDQQRTFLVLPDPLRRDESLKGPSGVNFSAWLATFGRDGGPQVLPQGQPKNSYRFVNHYHPYACLLIRELRRSGVPKMLRRELQLQPWAIAKPNSAAFSFDSTYDPQPIVTQDYPTEEIDFSFAGSYAQYNWEIFFHIPLLIADRLMQNQRFEEAQQWLHHIFDPTDISQGSAPQRFWRTKPFHETSAATYQQQQIETLMSSLASGTSDSTLKTLIARWRETPFNPHLIARFRTTAYQKTVVMKYVENLIAWGDQLFRRETLESLNEATQLYVMASEILGRRPAKLKRAKEASPKSFNELESTLDDFSNALVDVENVVTVDSAWATWGGSSSQALQALPVSATLYFCVPPNEKLLGYWDTVADRLFKIRHCLNIDGVFRQLPLFESPIDPALLVKAAAAGLDIGAVLADMSSALPHYRFSTMVGQAADLCSEVRALGGALLAALEKKDAEALSLLRSTQEIRLLQAVRAVKQKQVDEAKRSLEATMKSRDMAMIRSEYYKKLDFVNAPEALHLALTGGAIQLQGISAGIDLVANFVSLIPQIHATFPPDVELGGIQLGTAMKAIASYLGSRASILSQQAGLSATIGGYRRRAEDWKLQETLATNEMQQLDKQIAAAEIRLAIAERDVENHDVQVENAKETDAFMRDKFTNRNLYDWMVSQVSAIHFQAYQLAYDVAKRAQQCYRFELADESATFINFGSWDSLRKGLLAGERLSAEIKRMQTTYFEKNVREYEITKNISLRTIDPEAFLTLKLAGSCEFELTKALFDKDYQHHKLRRLRQVGMTAACVLGPYSNINCKLTLQESDLDGKPASVLQSIVTSSGQNDHGLFDASLGDPRYLPFEGYGAISKWRIDLPPATNSFDVNSLSDVILHVRYTAREDGTSADALVSKPKNPSTPFFFSAKQDFPSEWHRFLNPSVNPTEELLEITLKAEHFPFDVRSNIVKQNAAGILLVARPNTPWVVLDAPPSGSAPTPAIHSQASIDEMNELPTSIVGKWKFKRTVASTDPAIEDLWFLIYPAPVPA